MHVNFISSRDTGKTRIYYVWIDNASIIQGKNTGDIIRKKFKSFLHNYQEELKMIKGSNFVFQSVDLLDYKLHRVRFRRGGSCIKSPKWLLHKGATINLIKLFMVEKRTRGGICQAIHRYAKANNKYMKKFNKDIESSYLRYLDANNLYGWAMSQT